MLPVVSLGDCLVDRVTWGPGEGLIHARTERSSVMLSEAQLSTAVQAPRVDLEGDRTKYGEVLHVEGAIEVIHKHMI